VSLPADPLEALNWAWNHWDRAWWIIGLIGAGIAWTTKRMREWSRRNALLVGPSKPKPAAMQWGPGTPAAPPAAPARPASSSSPTYAAAPSYAAAGYTAQPAYAAPAAAPPAHAPARKLHREGASAQRTVAPVARSVDVPQAAAPTGTWTLAGAFGDPAHARTAIVVAEVLGPPPGLR
jgi:hypothetical protein